MSRPSADQANKQNFIVNIQDWEFGNLVVRWREQDTRYETYLAKHIRNRVIITKQPADMGIAKFHICPMGVVSL